MAAGLKLVTAPAYNQMGSTNHLRTDMTRKIHLVSNPFPISRRSAKEYAFSAGEHNSKTLPVTATIERPPDVSPRRIPRRWGRLRTF